MTTIAWANFLLGWHYLGIAIQAHMMMPPKRTQFGASASYRRRAAAKQCVDCGEPAIEHVRCPDCHAGHCMETRAKRNTGKYRCSSCGEVGHTLKVCPGRAA